MIYYAKIQELENGYLVTFRDVPEALTEGSTLSEAVDMAQDALKTALEFYTEKGLSHPRPTPKHLGEYKIFI